MRFTILLAALGIFGGSSAAATITFSGIDWGNYSSAGAHRAASWSYVAGNCSNTICPATGVYRDFFVFDLSALAAVQGVDVTDATLTLINPASVKLPLFNGGYRSPNMNVSGDPGQPADTFSVFDVSSTIASVRANQATGAAGAAIYNDLGSGASYGSALADGESEQGRAKLGIDLFQPERCRRRELGAGPVRDAAFRGGRSVPGPASDQPSGQ